MRKKIVLFILTSILMMFLVACGEDNTLKRVYENKLEYALPAESIKLGISSKGSIENIEGKASQDWFCSYHRKFDDYDIEYTYTINEESEHQICNNYHAIFKYSDSRPFYEIYDELKLFLNNKLGTNYEVVGDYAEWKLYGQKIKVYLENNYDKKCVEVFVTYYGDNDV